MAIFLVRHTAPDIKPGVIYAASNVPVHQAEFMRVMPLIDAALPQEALIVTSHLTRCRRLADFLAMRGTGRIVIVDPRLTERDLGLRPQIAIFRLLQFCGYSPCVIKVFCKSLYKLRTPRRV